MCDDRRFLGPLSREEWGFVEGYIDACAERHGITGFNKYSVYCVVDRSGYKICYPEILSGHDTPTDRILESGEFGDARADEMRGKIAAMARNFAEQLNRELFKPGG